MQPDVVVVGAGLAGLAVAAQLASERRVLVLDAKAPGREASAQNAGMLRRMGEDPYERVLAVRTHAMVCADEELAALSRCTGAVLAFGRDPHHLHDAAAHLTLAGVPHEWWDRPQDQVPALRGAPLLGGWWMPEERVIDAVGVVGVLASRLERLGGTIRRVGVDALRRTPSGVEVVAGAEVWSPAAVVLAAGAWSAGLAASAGLVRPLFPLRRTVLRTGPDPLSSPEHPWCWVDDEGVYARPQDGGWLVSACDEVVDFPRSPSSTGSAEAGPTALTGHKVARWFPALSPGPFTSGWSGLRTFAPDRRPVLGADPEAPGLWWCAGLGGFGVSAGLAAGEAVAAWIRGLTVPTLNPRGVSPGRPMLARWWIRPDGDLANAVAVSGHLPELGR